MTFLFFLSLSESTQVTQLPRNMKLQSLLVCITHYTLTEQSMSRIYSITISWISSTICPSTLSLLNEQMKRRRKKLYTLLLCIFLMRSSFSRNYRHCGSLYHTVPVEGRIQSLLHWSSCTIFPQCMSLWNYSSNYTPEIQKLHMSITSSLHLSSSIRLLCVQLSPCKTCFH